MIVKILGGGCVNCRKLKENTETALNEMNMEYEIIHVKELSEYAKYGVVMTPALVIDEKLIVSGRVPDKYDLVKLIRETEGK